MSRVGGSYESVVRGVSEQAPQDRRSGQMWEQVNMISDPVRGLVRRHGSEYQNSEYLGNKVPSAPLQSAAVDYTTMSYFCEGREIELVYRRKPIQAGVTLKPIYAYDKTNNKFLELVGAGKVYAAMSLSGVSSMVNIGKFMFIAAQEFTPEWEILDGIEKAEAAKPGCVWIRNGDYSRTYTIRIVRVDGTTQQASYTTDQSSYPTALNTSQVPLPSMPANPTTEQLNKFQMEMANYNKQVADITNAYNSAVTSWIGTSTASIQPQHIANKLTASLETLVGANNVAVKGQFIYWSDAANIRMAYIEDGGDDTYMRAAVHAVDSVEKLTPQHYVGKVIKITAKKQSNKDAFYMKAHGKNNEGAGTFTEVQWRETAGQITKPTFSFAIAYADESKLYVGSTPDSLNALIKAGNPTSTIVAPPFKQSNVGDTVSVPIPNFFGKQINYLGVFQDRLLVGSGATVFASRPGDYFNWFRQSVLTIEDNDPVEMYSLGSEDDTIYWDTSFDRNHVLFGRKFQYIIPGRVMLSPKNPSIQVMSANEDAVEAQPRNSGNFVFYAKDTATKGSLHQIQMGATSDSSESYECSQQLDKYIWGKPCQIMCTTAPYNVVIRSGDYPNGVYLYTYLDSMQGAERLFDSWSRWEWDESLGPSCGMSYWKGNILMFTFRNNENGLYIVADEFTFDTEIAQKPYLDSWRNVQIAMDYPLWWAESIRNVSAVAADSFHPMFLLGSMWDKRNDNMVDWEAETASLYVGQMFNAYIVPTSPYLRDRNDKAIINGRLTLSNLTVALTDSGGCSAQMVTPNREYIMKQFEGRLLTRNSNLAGRVPLVNTSVMIPIYKEIREFKVYIGAITWLPLTITGIEWLGQWFSNVRRV